jgi:hypothetical protein
MRVIKDIAITEPLVDIVESRAVLTNAVPILHLDILTCTKAVHPPPDLLPSSPQDLCFRSEFNLRGTRNDFCHAFVAYFECAFTQVSPLTPSPLPLLTFSSSFLNRSISQSSSPRHLTQSTLIGSRRSSICRMTSPSAMEMKSTARSAAIPTAATHAIWTLRSHTASRIDIKTFNASNNSVSDRGILLPLQE